MLEWLGKNGLKNKLDNDSRFRSIFCNKISKAQKDRANQGIHRSGFKDKNVELREKARSQAAIAKRKETFENIGHQQGAKNSQFGTCWIHSIELQECKKIKKDDLELFLEQGWIRGRK